MSEITNNASNEKSENDKLNDEIEKQRQTLRDTYGETYERLEKIYYNMINTSYIGKTQDEEFAILAIIAKYENFAFHYNYDEKSGDIYNFKHIYSLYCKEISKSKDEFIKDLLYLFRWGLISIFILSPTEKSFIKSNMCEGIYRVPYNFLGKACQLYESITNNNANIKATIYFTADGQNMRKEGLGNFLINKAIEKQGELEKQIDNLDDEQKELRNRIDNFSKEIISIISIILAITPLVAINIAELREFNIQKLLLINGCLIIGITTIYSILAVIFFEIKRKHFLLLIPLVISIGLIIASFLAFNQSDKSADNQQNKQITITVESKP